MAYVLDYTVLTKNGKVSIVQGTDHADALRNFVANPAFKFSNHEGTYVPEDGEVIQVAGVSQDEYSDYMVRVRRVQNLRESVASGKRASRYERPIAERRAALADAEETLRLNPEPKPSVVAFQIYHEVVHSFKLHSSETVAA